MTRYRSNVIDISGRPRESVQQTDDKSADAMECDRFGKSLIQFVEECTPRQGRIACRLMIRRHIEDVPGASWLADSSVLLPRIDSVSATHVRRRCSPS